MRNFWAGLQKDLWITIAATVGLMSGIASIIREWVGLFHPAMVGGRLFGACLWTCFAVSVGIVIVRQRMAIVALQDGEQHRRDEQAEAQRLHKTFGDLMKEGEDLALELRRGMENHGPWLQRRNDWVTRVSKALAEMNLPTEAAAFRHSGEKDFIPGPGQVFDRKYQFQLYMGQLDGYRTELKEIVKRRLPPV